MVIHMIRLKLDHILSLDPNDLFKYVSNGHFITDCLMNESSFEQIFQEAVLVDFDDQTEFSKVIASKVDLDLIEMA